MKRKRKRKFNIFLDLLVNNDRLRKILTDEYLMCEVDMQKLQVIAGEIALVLLIDIQNDSVDTNFTEEKTSIRSSKYLNIKPEPSPEEFFDEPYETFSMERVALYVVDNLGTGISEVVEDLIIEGVFKELTVTKKKGRYILGKSETKLFNEVIKLRNEALKKRLNLVKTSPREKFWTLEKRQKLLEAFLKWQPIVKKAKSEARNALGSTHKERFNSIKGGLPELPDFIINILADKNIKVSPKDITLEYLSTLFEYEDGKTPSVDHLSNLIDITRKESKEID